MRVRRSWLGHGVLAIAISVASVTITGCGSSSRPPARSTDVFSGQARSAATNAATSPEVAPAASTPTTTSAPPAPPTNYIGTFTESGPGTKLTEAVSVGQLGYGAQGEPPASALSGTSVSWPISTSAFVYADLTFDYEQGTVPADLGFEFDNAVGSASGQGGQDTYAVMDVDGQWMDGGGNGVQLTVNPGQTITVPTWIDLNDAITNASPTLDTAATDDITFELVSGFDQASSTIVGGPNAANCDGNYQLLLLTKPSTASCSAGGGNWSGD